MVAVTAGLLVGTAPSEPAAGRPEADGADGGVPTGPVLAGGALLGSGVVGGEPLGSGLLGRRSVGPGVDEPATGGADTAVEGMTGLPVTTSVFAVALGEGDGDRTDAAGGIAAGGVAGEDGDGVGVGVGLGDATGLVGWVESGMAEDIGGAARTPVNSGAEDPVSAVDDPAFLVPEDPRARVATAKTTPIRAITASAMTSTRRTQ